MRRSLLLVFAVLMVAGGVFAAGHFAASRMRVAQARTQSDDLAWLRTEFGLSEAELEKVRTLHAAYLPECDRMCARIAAANRELASVIAASTKVTTTVQDKLGAVAMLRAECQAQMLRHFYEVSRSMPPGQGRRYLQVMIHKTCLPDHGMEQNP